MSKSSETRFIKMLRARERFLTFRAGVLRLEETNIFSVQPFPIDLKSQ